MIESLNKDNKPLLYFLIISLLLLLFTRQLEVIEPGSIKYYLIIIPALIFPLTKIQYISCNLFIKTWPLLLMVIITITWGAVKHDISAVYRLVLYLFILSWLEVSSLKLKVKTLSRVFLSLIAISIFIYLCSDINYWGLVPGTTSGEQGVWRVSFFPNIANTAFLSLFIFMICTKDKETFRNNKFVVGLSLYFIIFSFVRSAVISLIVYLILRFVFQYVKNVRVLFLLSIVFALTLNLVVGYSTEIIHAIQSSSLVDRLLLRGESNLTNQEIYVQMYRPWVWKQQWSIFINSPYLMGEGLYNFNDFISNSLRGEGVVESDEVSLLLGMLASYGISALLFYYYLLNKNYLNALKLDTWACSIFPVIIFICMQWGCIFHPACAIFVIFFLILVRGKNVFI